MMSLLDGWLMKIMSGKEIYDEVIKETGDVSEENVPTKEVLPSTSSKTRNDQQLSTEKSSLDSRCKSSCRAKIKLFASASQSNNHLDKESATVFSG